MKNYLEEIRISLPDYIQGKINNSDEIVRIEKEIKINPGLKNEYEELKKSMYLLKSARLTEPPEHYFNTILPSFNFKLEERKKSKQNIFSFLKFKNNYWGYLVPVVPILMIFFIYRLYIYNPGNIENSVYLSNHNKTELNKSDSGLNINKTENNITTPTEDVEDSISKTESSSTGNNTVLKNHSYNENGNDNNIIVEDIDNENVEAADIFSKDEDDIDNLQSQFNQLDDDIQSIILDNLKNEKL